MGSIHLKIVWEEQRIWEYFISEERHIDKKHRCFQCPEMINKDLEKSASQSWACNNIWQQIIKWEIRSDDKMDKDNIITFKC